MMHRSVNFNYLKTQPKSAILRMNTLAFIIVFLGVQASSAVAQNGTVGKEFAQSFAQSGVSGAAIIAQENKALTGLAHPHFQPEDIFELEVASDPQVSPNGKKIAYVRRSNDIMDDTTRASIWIVDVSGENHRPVISSQKNHYSPRWSPDGKRLAYVSTAEGAPQLYVRWMDTGQTALVTNVASSLSSIAWSRDGKTIAFSMSVASDEKPFSVKMPAKPKGANWADSFQYITKARYQADGRGLLDPAYTQIFIVPSDGGSARQLSIGNFHHSGTLSWGADSEHLYFSANRSENWEYEPNESDIYSIDMSGALQQISNAPGLENNPVVSPNGKFIAYSKRDDKNLAYRNRYLHVMDINGENDKNLSASVDNAVSNFHWKGNAGIYYQQMVRGVTQIDYVTLASAKHSNITNGLGGVSLGRPYTSGTFDYADATFAFTKGRHDRPADIFVQQGSKQAQLTQLNEDLFGHKTLGAIEEFTYNSSIDGEEIHGWYILPPDYDASKKYPLIIEIHGGPHLAYGPHFTAELQRMAAEGYIVFYNNHRGSSGYGERFALLLQNKYSSKYDFADHMSGIDALIEKGLVNEERLYITGGSAGGIATAYAIGLTDRFKAAVVAKPVINWLSKVLTADSGLSQIPNQFPGMPWEEFEHYWERSPLSLVGNVTTPTMLITGVDDKRTPMSETVQYYQALKLLKVDTVLVKVPGASHAIANRPSHLVGKIENILAWFEKYE
ncbi:dipeptidyl aminopeptidase/acylaminoacyl-peptidase [Glaciecola punicea ACAM 611]|uniref:Dipeptidyl aminopeptidase/acylaminoacyl-peptidase n=1 Tax=Glaciecola punicea ACAM 611 TaxID=1121923 RepID=H5TA15_9ALTE|nr:S9 family peptidase [Glaciecola punicea]GAB55142.1 dipeptidyl aminopeptidase/acylaminoacyl-peptidase [Glaciecola punicea ACAM 611]